MRLIRFSSTISRNLENAARFTKSNELVKTTSAGENQDRNEIKEEEEYREMFLKPNRKLRTQLRIEQLTGRAEEKQDSRRDINDRIATRAPRREEMSEDQDWPSVWPAAASFRASVVPLAIRMGSRRKPENRPPFKTVGNLELLKIPNFLHLTPEHIRRHCEAIKQFCTPFPKELINDSSLVDKYLPLTVSYSDYVHQSTSIRDMRARIVTFSIDVSNLRLDDHGKDKLRRLSGNRFDNPTNTLTVVTDRCFTRKQNRDYADYLLTVLYHESNKLEEWENQKKRADNFKVEFEGSDTEMRIKDLLSKMNAEEHEKGTKRSDASSIQKDPAVNEFVKTWATYRNTTETVKTTRNYGESVRKVLKIPAVTKIGN